MKETLNRLQIVAINSFKDAVRKKFLVALAVLCFFVLCMSLLLGQMSFHEQIRVTINFGLAAKQLALIVLAIFLGNHLIAQDLEQKTLLTILVRPISASLFFLGRYLGLSFVLLISSLFLSFMLIAFFSFLKIPLSSTLFISFLGFYLESLLILAFVFLFSSYCNSFLTLCCSISIFMIGHFLDSLNHFIGKAEGFVVLIFKPLLLVLPNLERVNWKSAVVFGDKVSFLELTNSSMYILFWIVFVLSVSFIIIENREYH